MAISNTLAIKLQSVTRDFESGMDRAKGKVSQFAEKNKSLGDVMANTVKAIGAMNPAVLAMGAAFAATAVAIAKITDETAKYAESLQKMAIRLDTTTEDLSTLAFAAEQSGSSLQAVQAAMAKLGKTSFDAQEGLLAQKQAFDDLGIEYQDAAGNLRPLKDLFLDTADAVKNAENQTKALALAQAIMGRGAIALKPLMLEGAEGIKALTAEAVELGREIGTGFAEESAVYVDNVNRIASLTTGFKNIIGEQFLPTFNVFLELIIEAGKTALPAFADAIFNVNFQVQRLLAAQASMAVETRNFGRRLAGGTDQLNVYKDLVNETREQFQLYTDGAVQALEATAGVGDSADVATEQLSRLNEMMETLRAQAQKAAESEELKALARLLSGEGFGPGGGTTDLAATGPGGPAAEVGLDTGQGPFAGLEAQSEMFFNSVVDLGRDAFRQLDTFATTFSDALVDSFTTGRIEFAKFIKDLLAGLLKAIVRALILRAILGIFGGGGVSLGKLLRGSFGVPGAGEGFGDGVRGGAGATASSGLMTSNTGGGTQTISSMEVRPVAIIREPSPFTTVEFVDTKVRPRLESQRDDLNAEPL
jgi:hypothetical protein